MKIIKSKLKSFVQEPINYEELLSTLKNNDEGYIIVKTFTSNCSGCKLLEKNWLSLESKLAKLKIDDNSSKVSTKTISIETYSINLKNNPKFIVDHNVRSVPTVFLFKDGEPKIKISSSDITKIFYEINKLLSSEEL